MSREERSAVGEAVGAAGRPSSGPDPAASAASAAETPSRVVHAGISLKMYLDREQTLQWVLGVAGLAAQHPGVVSGRIRLWALPAFPMIRATAEALEGTLAEHGAQDLFWEDHGPYTGEVSGLMLAQLGCRYVEVGHAERRRIFGEDDSVIRRKTAAAIRNGLVPVLCIGETEHLPAQEAAAFCLEQIAAATGGLVDAAPELVLAYEPVWAIGAAEPAGIDHIDAVVAAIRAGLAVEAGFARSSIIYGGSAGPGLFGRLHHRIDGLFLGRTAHSVDTLRQTLDEMDAALRAG